jgi:malonate decarboxylase beta subunit
MSAAAAALPAHNLLLGRQSFVELRARERAAAILDPGTFRELLGPFDRVESPWLVPQGVVPQSDDGTVVARGTIDAAPAVALVIEGAFQGGSTGEVSGAKIASVLELALRDAEAGRPVRPVLVLETGGVRLQEANLGLAAVAEIHAAIVALRRHVPVVGVIAGMVGCFGGMSIAAGLCSHLIVTRQARLGLNGPEVIEQNAGIAELDSRDRALVWGIAGGEQRAATGFADELVEDDAAAIAAAVRAAFRAGLPAVHRSADVARWQARIAAVDTAQPLDGHSLRILWQGGREHGSA